jgi:hypothetical protein
MPRPKEFSEIAALDAAVDCFWQRGYEATSMRDLAVSMGVSAPSLYKRSGINRLFLPALWNSISIAVRATDWHCSVCRVKKARKCDERPALLATKEQQGRGLF